MKADSRSTVLAELVDSNSTARLSHSTKLFKEGQVALSALTIDAVPGETLMLDVSAPALEQIRPVRLSLKFEDACPAGEVALETAQQNVVCEPCTEGMYESVGQCLLCKKGMVCTEEALSLSSVSLASGYWRSDDASDEVLKCRFGDTSCPGDGNNQEAAGRLLTETTTAFAIHPYCSANHVGHLCSACAPGFFLSWTGDGKCHQCATGESHVPTVGLLGGVFVFVIACLACVYKKRKKKAQGTTASTQTNSLFSKMGKVYSLAKFKVFTLFLTSQVELSRCFSR